jgi:hypothetical protein
MYPCDPRCPVYAGLAPIRRKLSGAITAALITTCTCECVAVLPHVFFSLFASPGFLLSQGSAVWRRRRQKL